MGNCKVVSFVNAKGGSGKTSSSSNFAWCLSSFDYKVLVIDFDLQANCSFTFGCLDYETRISIVDLLRSKKKNLVLPKKEEYIFSIDKNLDLICCNRSLSFFKEEMSNTSFGSGCGDFLLDDFLKASNLINEYDFIIIDNSPAIDIGFNSVIVASNYIIIPVETDAFNSQGMFNLITALQNIINDNHRNLNDITIAGILFTRNKNNTILSKKYIPEYEKYGFPVFNDVIPENASIPQAQEVNSVACKVFPKEKASIAYMNITKEFLERVGMKYGEKFIR